MPRKLPLFQVDAFTRRPYQGNPCAVVLDADDLSETTMQMIALEMNLSETAFVMNSDIADVRARYFTPSSEIPLAGHPTLATVFTLIHTGRLPSPDKELNVSLQLEAGVIPISVTADEGTYRVTMTQPRPEFLRQYDPTDVMPAFGLNASDVLGNAPIMTVSTGTPQLMIPLRSKDSLRRACLDIPAYRRLLAVGDFFSPHLFVLEGATDDGDTFARHFGLPPDTFEDPFTGSATGGMAAYIFGHGLLPKAEFVAEQGHWMGRPGKALVQIIEGSGGIEGVRVGGHAVQVLTGDILVPDRAGPVSHAVADQV